MGYQGPFGGFGFPFWLVLSFLVVVQLFHSHCILWVKIVPYWLIFVLKTQRASRLSSPEGIEQYLWIRAGVLQYNMNQHQVSFRFVILCLTFGKLKMLRAHSQVAALNAWAEGSLSDIVRVLLHIHRQHFGGQSAFRASELMRKFHGQGYGSL